MADPYAGSAVGRDSPAPNVSPVTPNDGADLATRPRFLIVGTGGNLKGDFDNGTTTIVVPAGVVPISPKRIWSTGTTAANITACW